ncbi:MULTISPECIES: flagellar biosynthesis protein FlhB [Burkholderia]|uniref:flagellar biosynthesis protein FlhB n=1 Tax=Burkholderia TaxID=32008 RepID=UPI000B0D04B0|nr:MULTISPECIES: flagellar biosynthesis protein FlhB [unclassified Burkholderia]
MAEDSDLDRTEAATPKRREKARDEGQVARSRELASFALLSAGFYGAWLLAAPIGAHLCTMLAAAFSFDRARAFDTSRMLADAGRAGAEGLYALAPVLALTGIAALAAPLALGGWLISTKTFEPKLERLNPLAGLGRIFSMRGLIQLGMAIAKTLVVGVIGGVAIWRAKDDLLGLVSQPLVQALADALHLVAVCCGMTVAGMLVVAGLDVPYQLWQHDKKLRMTKEEVKREHRENEGDPHVKGRIRQQQRALARRRMMANVPTADVVVTNPTHFAVALKYTDGEMRAPKVVAKGVNLVAARIRELAAEHRVPLLEAPPLARALYHHVELEREIPGALYAAVAEVLAWVYQLKRFHAQGGEAPAMPVDLDVPAELDKGARVASEDEREEAEDALGGAGGDHGRGMRRMAGDESHAGRENRNRRDGDAAGAA